MKEAVRSLAGVPAFAALLDSREQDVIAKEIARALLARDRRAAEICEHFAQQWDNGVLAGKQDRGLNACMLARDSILSLAPISQSVTPNHVVLIERLLQDAVQLKRACGSLQFMTEGMVRVKDPKGLLEDLVEAAAAIQSLLKRVEILELHRKAFGKSQKRE